MSKTNSQPIAEVPQSKTKPATLTREQEFVAFQLMRQGGHDGEKAREMFVYINEPLVGSVASRYRAKGLTWDELLSAGKVGLLKAIDKFDYMRGLRFSTCAVPWIKGEITAEFKHKKINTQSDRRIRQTDNGVPLVFDEAVEKQLDEDEALQKVARKDLEKQNEPEGEELTDHVDLREAVAQDAELKEVVPKGATGCEKDEGGLDLNTNQARNEGIGSVAGCAEFSVDVQGEEASSDASPGAGGLAINFAVDRTLGVMSVHSDLIPALEEAVERLKDPHHALVFRMRLGLGGHKQHKWKEIGDALDVTAQRAEAIFHSTFAQLREDPTLELLFDLSQ